VDSTLSREDLKDFVVNFISGNIDSIGVITSDGLEISVLDNNDFNRQKRQDKEIGFMYYRYLLELEPMQTVKRDSYINSISRLIKYLRTQHCKVAAACDFEDELVS
jgi:hypothetical protein